MTDQVTVSRELLRQVLDALCAAMEFDAGDAESEVFDAATELRAALEQPGQPKLDIKPPNESGSTLCTVRWMAETPHGWVGSWDREALEQFAAPQPVQEKRND